MKKHIRAMVAFDGVERAEDGGPPTAFRVWREGMNVTDHGPTIFSKRSAELLMSEQTARANRYSMDINHLSLDKTAPLENQRAVGFFSLEVRDGDLWAVDCEWTDTVRAGLTKNPPEWKYFSPAYDVDKETDEVVSFLNCALTNTPATWGVTALASRRAKGTKTMKWSDIKAALEGKDEDAKASAYATIAAAFPDEDAPDSKKDSADEPKDEPKKDSADEPKDEPKKDSADEPKDEPKKDVKASVVASQDAALAVALARIAKLEAKDEEGERSRLIAGREMTPALAKTLSSMPVAEVRSICAGLPPKAKKDPAAAAKVAATRGDGQGDGNTSRLPPDEKAALDARMGLKPRAPQVRRDGRVQTFETMTAAEARKAIQASNAKKEGAK